MWALHGHSHGIGKSGIFGVLAQLLVTQGVTKTPIAHRSFFKIFLHKMSRFRENDRTASLRLDAFMRVYNHTNMAAT